MPPYWIRKNSRLWQKRPLAAKQKLWWISLIFRKSGYTFAHFQLQLFNCASSMRPNDPRSTSSKPPRRQSTLFPPSTAFSPDLFFSQQPRSKKRNYSEQNLRPPQKQNRNFFFRRTRILYDARKIPPNAPSAQKYKNNTIQKRGLRKNKREGRNKGIATTAKKKQETLTSRRRMKRLGQDTRKEKSIP